MHGYILSTYAMWYNDYCIEMGGFSLREYDRRLEIYLTYGSHFIKIVGFPSSTKVWRMGDSELIKATNYNKKIVI